jgi:putative SOS response-associated peptidase YedK
MQDTRIRNLFKRYGLKPPPGVDWDDFIIEILPHLPGIVLREDASGPLAEQMEFSFVSKAEEAVRGRRLATFNARLDSLTEKPTWRAPLETQRCVVPISEFHEPAYWGPLAGNIVRFTSPEPLLAAGLWKKWRNPKDGLETSSFAIIVHEAYPIVEEYGHDRSPVFLDETAAEEWIRGGRQEGGKLVQFLEHRRAHPKLEPTVQRAMKAGWEKRIPLERKSAT